MVDRDPLDALRDAWKDVRPPAPDRDPATDALVDDLSALWKRVETPEPDADSFRLALRHRGTVRRWRDRAVLAAAASLLVALTIVASHSVRRAPRHEEQLAAHEHPAPVELAAQLADPRVRTLTEGVRARTLDDGELELRHGRVRLVLGGWSRTTIEPLEPAARPAANSEEDSK
ncbi:MAG: hypothetical protein H6831_02720 [Planctomycetes bacterium]|nr:hypothetical protein [Planctomycetota bacterium]MCB9903297.1 hypothetical protein [Planctomycetota bacterium]